MLRGGPASRGPAQGDLRFRSVLLAPLWCECKPAIGPAGRPCTNRSS